MEIGQWALLKRGSLYDLVQVAHVGFICEVALARRFADGREEFEFLSASEKNLILVDPEEVVWRGSFPYPPDWYTKRQRQIADEVQAERARNLDLARQPGTKWEVIMGASGRWVARRIVADLGNGKFGVAEPTFTGHVPVRKLAPNVRPSDIVRRQLRRKISLGETASFGDGPRGGSSFVIKL